MKEDRERIDVESDEAMGLLRDFISFRMSRRLVRVCAGISPDKRAGAVGGAHGSSL